MGQSASLTDAVWAEVEALVKRFEDAWRSGSAPRVADALTRCRPTARPGRTPWSN